MKNFCSQFGNSALKKLFTLFFILFMVNIGFAQTLSEVESQINQSIQTNQNEYQRLLDLQKSSFNDRQVVLLQRQHSALRSQIRILQQDIEKWIKQPSHPDFINDQMTRLRELMREEERMKARIDALKNN